ncbi:DUF5320 domain-containing protein [Crassaminicella profunda]|uniref:DUF5320 domain-containing protein n=1 Tax=Crassaminicella profunda TaxID=1286698 RepID=UPI001CA6C02E|nr:DUF5320 domain-containing protein [Crassaminicella profunda]QZY53798.1 DUF5320 domain-containing protein [Crassaminicella profunda]
MPGLDGRGPNGMGSGTGRKRGYCNVSNDPVRYGSGYGRGLGLCRWMGNTSLSEQELLKRQKEILEMELEGVKKRLGTQKDTSKSE